MPARPTLAFLIAVLGSAWGSAAIRPSAASDLKSSYCTYSGTVRDADSMMPLQATVIRVALRRDTKSSEVQAVSLARDMVLEILPDRTGTFDLEDALSEVTQDSPLPNGRFKIQRLTFLASGYESKRYQLSNISVERNPQRSIVVQARCAAKAIVVDLKRVASTKSAFEAHVQDLKNEIETKTDPSGGASRFNSRSEVKRLLSESCEIYEAESTSDIDACITLRAMPPEIAILPMQDRAGLGSATGKMDANALSTVITSQPETVGVQGMASPEPREKD